MADAALTTRDRLLEAARELFTTAGYFATTTPILAKRAGVAEGTIYRHFPSKQALLNAAYQDTQRWGAVVVREAGQGKGRTVGERLGAVGRHWLEQAEVEPARVRMLLVWRLTQELDEPSRMAAAELRQGLEHLIALGKQEGSVRAGVVELWTSVWLTLVSFAAEKVASREWTASHPHALATLDAAWEAIAWRPIVVAPPTAAPG
ncbi:MAG: TetR/AcrR family transcriptional regulator [Gemmatimonadota bacterium]